MKEQNKPCKIFINLNLILSSILITFFIIRFIVLEGCPQTYYVTSVCGIFGSGLIIFFLFLTCAFTIYSLIMLIYIFAKKIKKNYFFTILSIILHLSGAFLILNSSSYLSLIPYSILFIISLFYIFE